MNMKETSCISGEGVPELVGLCSHMLVRPEKESTLSLI
jgi:hypothetical protein